jgi:hypothetical protein
VLAPNISARMEKPLDRTSEGICAICPVPLVEVAEGTRPGEVRRVVLRRIVLSELRFGLDVLDLELGGSAEQFVVQATVFADVPSPGTNKCAQIARDPRHVGIYQEAAGGLTLLPELLVGRGPCVGCDMWALSQW